VYLAHPFDLFQKQDQIRLSCPENGAKFVDYKATTRSYQTSSCTIHKTKDNLIKALQILFSSYSFFSTHNKTIIHRSCMCWKPTIIINFFPVPKNWTYKICITIQNASLLQCWFTAPVVHNTWSWPTIFLRWLFLKKENCGMNIIFLQHNNQAQTESNIMFLESTIAMNCLYQYFFFFFIRAWSICPRSTTAYSLIVRPLSPSHPHDFRCSHFRCQVRREILAAKGRTMGGNVGQ